MMYKSARSVAIVGAGRWGRVLCKELVKFTPNITLVAENNYNDTLQWLALQNELGNIKLTADLYEVLNDDTITCAVVAKKLSEHFIVAKRLIDSGKHVLVEKPFTLTLDGSETLISLAAQSNLILSVGHEYLFARNIHDFRESIDGQLSPEYLGANIVWHDLAGEAKWGGVKRIDPSTAVIDDFLPHILSQLSVIFGPKPIEIFRFTSIGTNDAQIGLKYGTTLVHVDLNRAAESSQRTITVSDKQYCRILDFSQANGSHSSLYLQFASFFSEIEHPKGESPGLACNNVEIFKAMQAAHDLAKAYEKT